MAKPLQVYLDEADLARLAAWSKHRGWTKSQAVRAAIRALTRPPIGDPLLAASGFVDGLPEDCSAHFDRHLQETYVAEHSPSYRRRRARTRLRR